MELRAYKTAGIREAHSGFSNTIQIKYSQITTSATQTKGAFFPASIFASKMFEGIAETFFLFNFAFLNLFLRGQIK